MFEEGQKRGGTNAFSSICLRFLLHVIKTERRARANYGPNCLQSRQWLVKGIIKHIYIFFKQHFLTDSHLVKQRRPECFQVHVSLCPMLAAEFVERLI